MSNQLTEEQIAQFKEAFLSFNQHADGIVSTKYLGTILRSLGENPTEVELQDMINEVDDCNGTLDFQDFLGIMQRKAQNINFHQKVIDDCKIYDRSRNGLISIVEFKIVLKNLGEQLSEQEFDELMKEANIDMNNCFKYEEFIRKIMG